MIFPRFYVPCFHQKALVAQMSLAVCYWTMRKCFIIIAFPPLHQVGGRMWPSLPSAPILAVWLLAGLNWAVPVGLGLQCKKSETRFGRPVRPKVVWNFQECKMGIIMLKSSVSDILHVVRVCLLQCLAWSACLYSFSVACLSGCFT